MEQCAIALERGIDLRGVCIYPVIDRSDWDELQAYIPCGFYGYCDKGIRTAHNESVAVLREWVEHPSLQVVETAELV